MMPYFSVIMPTYNRAHLIQKSIESLLKQSMLDWELIVVDDGSTDNTKEVVGAYDDPRIRYLYQDNQERSAARNNGLEHAQGIYACFLDSDDWYTNDRLKTLKIALEEHENQEGLFFTNIAFSLNEEIRRIEYDHSYRDQPLEFLLQKTLGTPQVVLSQNIYNTFRFNPEFNIGEDLELWLRIAEGNPITYLPDVDDIVALEHDERSLNQRDLAFIRKHVKVINFVLTAPHPGSKVDKKLKAEIRSNSYFNIAKFYMSQSKKFKALPWILKSIIAAPTNEQSKHKLYCLLNIITFRTPREYQ